MTLELENMVPPNEIAFDPDFPSFLYYLLPPERAAEADIAFFGVPYAGGTFRLVGTNLGPVGVRDGLKYFRSYSTELDIDIGDYLKAVDLGNVDVVWNNAKETFSRVDKLYASILGVGLTPLMIGGDHSITYQSLKTFVQHYKEPTGIIWFDNHLDSMEDYQGDKDYCGCPLFNIVHEFPEYIKPENIVHIGSRGFHNGTLMWRNLHDMGIKGDNLVKAEEVHFSGIKEVMDKAIKLARKGTRRLYVTMDIDVGEGIVAPGTQCPRPGGLFSWQMLYAVRRVGQDGADAFDLMEVAPTVDIADGTIMLAASLVLEYIAGLAWRKENNK